MTKDRLFIIDGSSLLYRSYYAIQRLSNSKGFPTNAIFGFISMLRKIMEKENPQYIGIVFDSKGPTFRHDLYKEYKANRKPMPEDLVPQVPLLKKVIKAFNIPQFEIPYYEADDVMGTLARQAKKHRVHTFIVTTDKDLFQVIDETTSVYNTAKDIIFDKDKVKENFGVLPSQIIDVLALWGDPSDNIPGVPGVGEKTAKILINQFGSLDNLIDNLDQVTKKSLKDKLQEHMDTLQLSRELVTIRRDLDLPFKLKDLARSDPNIEELIPLFQELEFSSFLSELLEKSHEDKKGYTKILDENKLKNLVARIKKAGHVSVDTETDSPHPTRARLVGISFSTEPHKAAYLPLGHDYPGAPNQIPKDRAFTMLKDIFSDPEIKKFGQNIKYDLIVLTREGLKIQGIHLDSMVLSYLLEPTWGKHNLGKLALTYLQKKAIPYKDIAGTGKSERTLNSVNIDEVMPYACQDADFAFQLCQMLWKKTKEAKLEKLYHEFELPLIEVLAQMETWGVKINSKALEHFSAELHEDIERLRNKIYETSGVKFNINSPQQLASILFDKMGIPPLRKTKKTRSRSTNVSVLQELAEVHPIARSILEYRQLTKLKSTYADALPLLINPETGRIHTSYNQTVTATGRLSSSEPNLQNIPVRGELGIRCRQAFIPESGHLLLSADYSQIELRVLAHLSGDPALIDSFQKDRDIHQETAVRVFGQSSSLFEEEQRRRAKIINFSMIYGASAFSLARELGTSNSEAQAFIDLYYEKHPKVHAFLEKSVEEAEKKGYSETFFGRKRPVPELRQSNKMTQQMGRRIALNTPIQGTAADIMKKAMIETWKAIKTEKLKTKMILQVHDELVFEVPKNEVETVESVVKEKMEGVFSLKVPLKVHLAWGINWAEAK